MRRSVHPEMDSLSIPLLLFHSLSYLVASLHIQKPNSEASVTINSSSPIESAWSSVMLMWLCESFQSLIPSSYPLPLLSSVLQHLKHFFSLLITCDCLLIHLPHSSVISFRSGPFVSFVFEFLGLSWELVLLVGIVRFLSSCAFFSPSLLSPVGHFGCCTVGSDAAALAGFEPACCTCVLAQLTWIQEKSLPSFSS